MYCLMLYPNVIGLLNLKNLILNLNKPFICIADEFYLPLLLNSGKFSAYITINSIYRLQLTIRGVKYSYNLEYFKVVFKILQCFLLENRNDVLTTTFKTFLKHLVAVWIQATTFQKLLLKQKINKRSTYRFLI